MRSEGCTSGDEVMSEEKKKRFNEEKYKKNDHQF